MIPLLGRTYPIQLPSTIAATPIPGDPGVNGTDGEDGVSLLFNTAATPITENTNGSFVMLSGHFESDTFDALDIARGESLFSFGIDDIYTAEFYVEVGGVKIITARINSTSIAMDLPTNPPTASVGYLRLTYNINNKTAGSQIITRKYEILGGDTTTHDLAPLNTNFDLTGEIALYIGVNFVAGATTVTNHYNTLTKYKFTDLFTLGPIK
jgi:hypothetical protein